jgi:ABC-type sugar transport system ATPase subunit
MNVYDNIAYALKISGMTSRISSGPYRLCVHELDIVHLLDRFPDTLSGGEKQRVALTRTLMTHPLVYCSTSRCLLWMPVCAMLGRFAKKAVLQTD